MIRCRAAPGRGPAPGLGRGRTPGAARGGRVPGPAGRARRGRPPAGTPARPAGARRRLFRGRCPASAAESPGALGARCARVYAPVAGRGRLMVVRCGLFLAGSCSRRLDDRGVVGRAGLRPLHPDHQRPGGVRDTGLLGDDRGAARSGRLPSADRLGAAAGRNRRTRDPGRRRSGDVDGGPVPRAEQRGFPELRSSGRSRFRPPGGVAGTGRRRRCRSVGPAARGPPSRPPH